MSLKDCAFTLFTSPSRFFAGLKEGRWPKETVLEVWLLTWLGCTLLGSLGHSLELGRYGIQFHLGGALWQSLVLQAVSAPLALGMGGAIVVFLWVTGWAVKAQLGWKDCLLLTLFFSLPAALAMNMVKPLALWLIVDTQTLMGVNLVLVLIFLLWALTTMVLGIQGLAQCHWFRALVVVIPVMLLIFMAMAQLLVPVLLELLGLSLHPAPSTGPANPGPGL